MIKNIVFDAGGVVIHFNKTLLQRDLIAELFGISPEEAQEIWRENISRLVWGEIRFEDFLNDLRDKFKSKYSTEELWQKWIEAAAGDSQIDEEVVQLIIELKKDYKVYLLTNTTDSPIGRRVRDEIAPLFHATFRSNELKLKKPEKEIFLHLLKETKSKPEETIFIDDKEENVVAAQKLEMKGVIYQTAEQLKTELAGYGVRV